MGTAFNKILNSTCRIEESSSESENDSNTEEYTLMKKVNIKKEENINSNRYKIENNFIIKHNNYNMKTVSLSNINDLRESAFEKLNIFLNANRITKDDKDKGVRPTHTCLHPGGSYVIHDDIQDDFMEYYINALKEGNSLYLIERHRPVGPILIDIDFKINDEDEKKDDNKKYYNRLTILDFVRAYTELLFKYLNVRDDQKYVLVFERTKSYKCQYNHTNIIKDGFHLIFPGISTEPELQHILRDKFLTGDGVKNVEQYVFKNIEHENSIEDVFDASVIYQNGWFMYGSGKYSTDSYKLTSKINLLTLQDEDISEYTDEMLVDICSIRRDKYSMITYTLTNNAGSIDEIKKYYDAKGGRKNKVVYDVNKKDDYGEDRCNETILTIDNIKKLVNLLSVKRADNYFDWLYVGICLYNINHSEEYLKIWDGFSRKSDKYTEGACKQKWGSFNCNINGYNVGSLRYWAKEDDLEGYKKLLLVNIEDAIDSFLGGGCTDYDMARVCYMMLGDELVCINPTTTSEWMRFDKRHHIWAITPNGNYFRMYLSQYVYDLFEKQQKKLNDKYSAFTTLKASMTTENNEDCLEEITARIKILNTIKKQVRTEAYKSKIIKEASHCFVYFKERIDNISDFENELNMKPQLVGFKNGVYDLDVGQFRDGIPDDMISLSTKINFKYYNDTDEIYIKCKDVLNKILCDEEVREYILSYIASCYYGYREDEIFTIWTGTGANGKTILQNMIEKAFGNYYKPLSAKSLTSSRVEAGKPDPELFGLKGARVAFFSEPDDTKTDSINSGYIKQLTGGESISTRTLHKENITFKPNAALFLACNDIPRMTSTDGGTWRRISVVPFESKFYIPEKYEKIRKSAKFNENRMFLADSTLKNNKVIEELSDVFSFILLTEYYPKYIKYYKTGKRAVPDKVNEAKMKYKRETNLVEDFAQECLEVKKGSKVMLKTLHDKFRDWCDEGVDLRKLNLLNKKQFGLVLSRTDDIGTPCLTSSVKSSYWMDVRIKGEVPNNDMYNSDTESSISSDNTMMFNTNNIISISCNNSADNSDDDNIDELDIIIKKQVKSKFNIKNIEQFKIKRTNKQIRQNNKNFMKLIARFKLYESNKQHTINKLISIGNNNGYNLSNEILFDLKNNYIELLT